MNQSRESSTGAVHKGGAACDMVLKQLLTESRLKLSPEGKKLPMTMKHARISPTKAIGLQYKKQKSEYSAEQK